MPYLASNLIKPHRLGLFTVTGHLVPTAQMHRLTGSESQNPVIKMEFIIER